MVYKGNCAVYSYKPYKVRKYLAAIDWNYHLHLPIATKYTGEQMFSRKYNQCVYTQQWENCQSWQGVSLLIAKMFHARQEDVDLVTWHVSLNESDRHLLAPTIAAKPPLPTAELIKHPSRFSLPSERSEEKKAEEESSLMEHWSGKKIAKEATVFGPSTLY